MLADVIFPLFDLPYMGGIFSPAFAVGALVCELFVFYAFQFRTAPFWMVLAAVLSANLVSTLVGFFGLAFLPSPENGPHWLIYLTFIVAWALSVIIEYGVYFAVPRWRRFSHLFLAVAVSNLASYFVLALATWHNMV
jgi:hypothetical protein